MPDADDIFSLPPSVVSRIEGDAQSLIRREAEAWLVERCRETLQSAGQWTLDYTSLEAYESSCEPHRERWSRTLGEWNFEAPFDPLLEPFYETDDVLARWLRIDLADGLQGRAVLALPKNRKEPLPLVIAQHGLGSSPERVFGLNDEAGYYQGYARALVSAGYAVLAPLNVIEGPPRARLARLCHLLGRTLWGLETGKLRRFIDYVSDLPEIDASRIGMWGLSLGGYYTVYTAPLEKRIKVAICAACFNERWHKMAVSSPLYTAYIDVEEEHFWIPGYFSGGFGDAELAALICPRALQFQQGRADGIGWWPIQEKEFERCKNFYDQLGAGDRIEYAGHNGGHEIRTEQGLDFLRRFL
jgi:hypothetical protein